MVNALAELEASGVAIYADRGAVDGTTPHGRAMLQMAAARPERRHECLTTLALEALSLSRIPIHLPLSVLTSSPRNTDLCCLSLVSELHQIDRLDCREMPENCALSGV